MRKVILIDQNREGLLEQHGDFINVTYETRATIPVIEVLQKAGAKVIPLEGLDGGYNIIMGNKMPDNIIAVHLNSSAPRMGLRLDIEPEYPQEHFDYWLQVAFTPCPKCKAPVVWYEAGYVPGYRVCTKDPHHHSRAI